MNHIENGIKYKLKFQANFYILSILVKISNHLGRGEIDNGEHYFSKQECVCLFTDANQSIVRGWNSCYIINSMLLE